MGFLKSISDKLFKTKNSFTKRIHEESVKDEPITDEYLEFIEELLIESDFGVKTTMKIMEAIEKGIADGLSLIHI